MNPLSPLLLITAIGPNAWYVLGILVTVGQPMTQKRLQAIAKMSANTISLAVANLIEHRLAVRIHRYAVQATQGAIQLVLGQVDIMEPHKLRLGVSKSEAPDSLVVSSSRDPLANDQDLLLPLEIAGTSKSEAPDAQVIHNVNGKADIFTALDAAGIQEPARSQLAALPHVSAPYIRAHAVQCLHDEKPIPVLIFRLRNAWREPFVRARTVREQNLLYGFDDCDAGEEPE